jgi:hypothetical protein
MRRIVDVIAHAEANMAQMRAPKPAEPVIHSATAAAVKP